VLVGFLTGVGIQVEARIEARLDRIEERLDRLEGLLRQ
jgi:hypothetical protein